MAFTVSWSLLALDDLQNIWEYLAPDSPVYAGDLVDDLLLSASTLTEFPERGRISHDIENAREIFVHNYRLIYEIADRQVEILAIVHMARNAPSKES